MVEFVIALGVTPYFGIAAQALDDAESMTLSMGLYFLYTSNEMYLCAFSFGSLCVRRSTKLDLYSDL